MINQYLEICISEVCEYYIVKYYMPQLGENIEILGIQMLFATDFIVYAIISLFHRNVIS